MKLLRVLSIVAMTLVFSQTLNAEVGGDPEKIGGWVFAYEHDAAGNALSGNVNRLEKAFTSGGDFKVSIDNEVLFTCTRVTRSSSVYGCTYETLNLVGSNPLLAYADARTDGSFVIYRTSLFGGADQGSTVTTRGLRWYVKVR